jgi:prepilin signal peptidase PulO-like enzyme (type II secretory pathway)
MGDIKLVAAIGGFLGALPAVIAVLLGASLLGALTGIIALLWTRRRVYAPFGPALATASIVYVLIGDAILPRMLPGLAMWLRSGG